MGISGDFNARKGSLIDFIQYEDSTFLDTSYMENQQYSVHSFSLPNNMDKKTNKYGRSLNEICISNDLYFLNGRIRGDNSGKFTCHKFNRASVVDYAIVSSCLLDKIIYFSVHSPDYYSCHCLISFCLKTRPFDRGMDDSNESFKLLPMPDSFQWENNANVVFQKLLSDHFQSSELTNCAKHLDNNPVMIDHTVEVFTKEIKNITAKCLNLRKSTKKPKRPNKSHYKQWYNRDCQPSQKLLKNAAKNLANYPNDPIVRGRYHKMRKEHKKLIKHTAQKFKEQLLDKINSLESNNPKDFWSMVNSLKEAKQNNIIDSISPQIWFDWFKKLNSVSNVIDNNLEKEIELVVRNKKDFSKKYVESLDQSITKSEIIKASRKLKNGKSTGFDGISNEMIKSIVLTKFCDILVILFNGIMKTSYFPKCWKTGLIVPIFKSGESSNPGNYRGVTITSCFGKLFTLIINERLIEFLNYKKTINVCQIGFRKGYRTADHVFVLNTIINSYFKKGKNVYACFVDFSKAFDTVWRKGLLYKLMLNGLSYKFIKLIESMYQGIKCSVKLSNGTTPLFNSYVGLRQGCNLSPMLFNLFINDIFHIFYDNSSECFPVTLGKHKLNCLMYADDLLILSETEQGLICSLHKLKRYSDK